jgi:uncharacterized phage protein (TIGR01671 family)
MGGSMRDIKFRGKQILGGEWIAGDYITDVKEFHRTCNEAYILPHWDKLNGPIRVNPSTVGQFTGLLDKNGKEIYEGDVLDAGDRIVKVKWNGSCGCWDTDWISYKGPRSSNGVSASEWEFRTELIGNIHDNPELLKEEV